MKDANLAIRLPISTIREFRTFAEERRQSLSDLLRDAAQEALTYHAAPGECTTNYPPKSFKIRQGERQWQGKRRGLR